MQTGYKIALGIYYALFGTIGLLGNIAVLYAALKNRKQWRNISYIYLIFLAMTDLLGSVIIVPYFMISLFLPAFKESLRQKYSLPCQFGAFFVYAIGINRILSLALMSADRYFAIMRPFLYKKFVEGWKVVIANCLVLLQSLATNLPMLIVPNWTNYDGQPGAPCGFVWDGKLGYLIPYIVLNFVIPLLVLVASNVVVFNVARKQRKQILAENTRVRVGIKKESLVFGMNEADSDEPTPADTDSCPFQKTPTSTAISDCHGGCKGSKVKCNNNMCELQTGERCIRPANLFTVDEDKPAYSIHTEEMIMAKNSAVIESAAGKSSRRAKTERISLHDIIIAFSTLVIVLVFAVTWLPFALSRVTFVLNRRLFSWNTVIWTSSLTIINSACNPLIVLGTRRDFQSILKEKLRFFRSART
ncbi:uncharacterized protein LOC135694936 [Rhopilema esculentum]|uniref:uncharacterized protein LOC135694936 n=1 Tax=Rhopilema esculentum TaxID=499914 RepID=UPI0031D88C1F|eukprot:gene4635-20910_t